MKMNYTEADRAFKKAKKNGDVRCSICNEQIFKMIVSYIRKLGVVAWCLHTKDV